MKNKYGIVPIKFKVNHNDVGVTFGDWCNVVIDNFKNNKLMFAEIELYLNNELYFTIKGFIECSKLDSQDLYIITFGSMSEGGGYSLSIYVHNDTKKYDVFFQEA